MKKIEFSEIHLIRGGGFCAKASGLLAGVGLGVAGLTYFGVMTVATGGTAGVLIAIAGAGVGIYCSAPIVEYRGPDAQWTQADLSGMSF